MKALIIISACILLALAFRIVEKLSSGRISSVGAKANNNSKTMARINLDDPESMKEALEHYKEFVD